MEYSLLKLIHIGAIVLWLGPAFGAWIVFKAVEHEACQSIKLKINRAFFAMVTLEHIAFIVLLVTGLYMAAIAGWFATPWLWQKLMIVGLIILPLELVDILLGNWLVAKASLSKHTSARQKYWIAMYHGPFTRLAILLIPLSVVLVMYLAVSKHPLI